MSILEPRIEPQFVPVAASAALVAGTATHSLTPLAPEERLIETLIGLLDDESAAVRTSVRRELARLAPSSLPALRRASERAEPRVRTRARKLVLELERERVTRRMLGFALHEQLDLERGLLLLSRFAEPRLDLRPTVLALDAFAAEVLCRIENARPNASRARILIDYLGREIGLCGDQADYHHPDNVYLHRALERRRGMPLVLTAIYVMVARRCGMRAAGVALPGHVVLRLYDRGKSLLVDVFQGGKLLSDRDCLRYLADNQLPFHPRWFDDSTDATLWVRHVRNLQHSYRSRGLAREVELLGALVAARERA